MMIIKKTVQEIGCGTVDEHTDMQPDALIVEEETK